MEVKNFNGTYLAQERKPNRFHIGVGNNFAEAIRDCMEDVGVAVDDRKGRTVATYKPIKK